MLPHYLVKTECSTVQLFSMLFSASHSECDAKSLIYRIYLPDMLSYVSYVYADKFKILEHVLKAVYPQHARVCQVHATASATRC